MNQPATIPASGRRLRILIVDDTEAVRYMLAALLDHEGFDAELAASAEEALQLVRLVRWDGLVLDFDLPDLNGAELYRRMQQYTDRHLPVLFFTCHPNEVLKLGLGDVPWVRLVPKPCSSRQFMAALEQCLRAGGEAAPVAGS